MADGCSWWHPYASTSSLSDIQLSLQDIKLSTNLSSLVNCSRELAILQIIQAPDDNTKKTGNQPNQRSKQPPQWWRWCSPVAPSPIKRPSSKPIIRLHRRYFELNKQHRIQDFQHNHMNNSLEFDNTNNCFIETLPRNIFTSAETLRLSMWLCRTADATLWLKEPPTHYPPQESIPLLRPFLFLGSLLTLSLPSPIKS